MAAANDETKTERLLQNVGSSRCGTRSEVRGKAAASAGH